MNKAFVKEEDGGLDDWDETDEVHDDAEEALDAQLGRNLITPKGLEALRAELKHLRSVERPKVVEVVSWAAGNGDRSENGDYIYGKKRLREIDRRMRYLSKRIDTAEPVDPALQTHLDRVFFGATVTYAELHDDGSETEHTIRIVGVDEADTDKGDVSWISPIAKALMKAEVGDAVTVYAPQGPKELEVVAVRYDTD
ncbi:transcription elongation factor GreB [Thalassobaculum sp. OXR-137]|uniref:transcription elongation factor GreB n=1 Tax=Thalassobaculum sp. OXR-137 TaxID=3100173 RepID=UPI002AC970AA|nr:transcription elongation factor GreB [Thalassobaculum sp. OXR-137]WPZ35098.1 transcription elongation factor GreB [Thalassobaculum sp. OXR-137]